MPGVDAGIVMVQRPNKPMQLSALVFKRKVIVSVRTCLASASPLLSDPLQQVSRFAVKSVTESPKGIQTYCSTLTGLHARNPSLIDARTFGKLGLGHPVGRSQLLEVQLDLGHSRLCDIDIM